MYRLEVGEVRGRTRSKWRWVKGSDELFNQRNLNFQENGRRANDKSHWIETEQRKKVKGWSRTMNLQDKGGCEMDTDGIKSERR